QGGDCQRAQGRRLHWRFSRRRAWRQARIEYRPEICRRPGRDRSAGSLQPPESPQLFFQQRPAARAQRSGCGHREHLARRHVGRPGPRAGPRRRSALPGRLTEFSERRTMSRIAKAPIELPKGVEFNHADGVVRVKGAKAQREVQLHPTVTLNVDDGVINVAPTESGTMAMAGTMRSLIANMIHGVTEGFEKKLELVGVGYRAQVQGKKLNLQLGFSHPVDFGIP